MKKMNKKKNQNKQKKWNENKYYWSESYMKHWKILSTPNACKCLYEKKMKSHTAYGQTNSDFIGGFSLLFSNIFLKHTNSTKNSLSI